MQYLKSVKSGYPTEYFLVSDTPIVYAVTYYFESFT